MESTRYVTWKASLDLKTCLSCRDMNGKIYEIGEAIDPEPPLHPNCRCKIERLKALLAGTATKKGVLGADWWLKTYGKLPDYYITKQDAVKQGWKPALGNFGNIAPGKMITRGIYKNIDGHLPSSPGRVWYEADINYTQGYRGLGRILFSNDGLIFVTYDHYGTFYEIV
jgi:hypothetical protein